MNAKDKVSFFSLVLNVLVEYLPSALQSHQELIVSRLDGTSWRISSHDKEQLVEMFCDHEEADSRLFMYASYCSDNAAVSRIMVFSSDTNVIVIACHHCNHLLQNCSEVWIRRNHAKKRHFIPIHRIYTTLGEKPTLEKEIDGVRDAIELVCLLYDSKCQVFDSNDLRYKLFCSKKNYLQKNCRRPIID